MSTSAASVSLDPRHPEAWTELPFEDLLTLSRDEVEGIQRDAVVYRFETLRPGVEALDRLASRQSIDRIDSIEDALPLFFDHKVLKSYPLSILEKRRFGQLTSWLGRLTTQDLSTMPLEGCHSVDEWLRRLDDHGMFVVHSSGTTGKLGFVPRSMVEFDAFVATACEGRRATCGVDLRTEAIPQFATSYRSGYQTMPRNGHALSKVTAGGVEMRIPMYDFAISSELLALAGMLKGAEERGELDTLEVDPVLIKARESFIERGRHRNEDIQQWFFKLVEEYRGRKVLITGTPGEMVRLALAGREQGIQRCDFSHDSVLFAGGGMKGVVPPPDWQELIKDFFCVKRLSGIYGMSEVLGLAPKCTNDHYHFFPYTVPLVLDESSQVLPKEDVQTGRMALFDLPAQTYWGGFITGDRVTIHWDDDCGCGWRSAWLEEDISRFSELEGGDDKISCAGTAEAYNEFMDYVSNI